MKKPFILFICVFALLQGAASAEAKELPGMDSLYDSEIYLKSEVMERSISGDGSVLGVSTDGSDIIVSSKLGPLEKSYFRDVTIKPPQDWYMTDDYVEETPEALAALYTYFTNEDMTSEIVITRFDSDGYDIKSLAEHIEAVCEACGYDVIGKGSAKVAGQKAKYVDSTNETYHSKIYTFIHKKVGYMVEFNTYESEWKAYKPVMEKSLKTLKVKEVK